MLFNIKDMMSVWVEVDSHWKRVNFNGDHHYSVKNQIFSGFLFQVMDKREGRNWGEWTKGQFVSWR